MRLRTAADFGAAIRNQRRRAGLTQTALARKVGVSRQWIVEVEKNKPGAPLALVLRTFNALDIVLQTGEAPGRSLGLPRAKNAVDLDKLLNTLRRKKS